MTHFLSILYFVLIIIGLLLTPCKSIASGKQQLSVAVLSVNEEQIAAFSDIFNQFEKRHPQVQIQLDFYSDVSYKQKMPDWLEEGKYNLMHWQAGQRLQRLVDQDLLQPIDSLIDKALLERNIQAPALAQVRINDEVQALPFAYYGWGFYYNKDLFKSLDLQAPQNWQEFIDVCHILKQNGVTPLIQATAEYWPVLGWLDYFTLDIGGTEFREQFATLGPVDKTLIDKVVGRFSELLGHNFFFAPTHNWTWQQAVTILHRKQAAMSFLGQFAESSINYELDDEIGYFSFPHQRNDEHQVKVEVAPIDVWLVPKAADKKDLAASLLLFLQEPGNSSALALNLKWLPLSKTNISNKKLDQRLETSLTTLRESDALVQYFDRDAQPEFSTNLAKGIAKSILLDDVAPLKGALLGETYIPSNDAYTDFSAAKKSMSISSLTGSKGTFVASRIMQIIYEKLGYSLAVSRYSNLEASLASYKSGSDGELARAAEFEDIGAGLIRIPEPLITTSILLVCKSRLICEGDLPDDAIIAKSSEMLVVNNWLAKTKLLSKAYKSTSAMIEAYKNDQISFMVLSQGDLFDSSLNLHAGTYRTIINIPFYHFVHKKHASLVTPINNELVKFKNSPEYKSIQTRYWLN